MSKQFDKQSAKNYIIGQVRQSQLEDWEEDSDGQIIVHTSLYRWSDLTVRDEPEPKEETKS